MLFGDPPSGLSSAELISLRRTLGRSGPIVLVTEDQPPLLEVIGRHLDGHSISGQRLDAVPFHLSRCIGDDCMSDVQLNAIAVELNVPTIVGGMNSPA